MFKMTIVDAVKYKMEFPERNVFYQESVSDEDDADGSHDFTEELRFFRNEYYFELSSGSYPSYWDHDHYGGSHFYTRHILGDIWCETEEELLERKSQESAAKKQKKKRNMEEIDQEIEALKKKKAALKQTK